MSVAVSERSSDGLKYAAAMFGIDDIQQLGKALCTRTIRVRSSGEQMEVPMSASESVAKDAVMKDLYSRLFSYIVDCLNVSLSNKNPDDVGAKSTQKLLVS